MKGMSTISITIVIGVAIMLIVASTNLRSGFILFPPASGQVTIFPGTETEKPTSPPPTQLGGGGGTSAPGFSAKDIADRNIFKVDADVKNLVILIPNKRLVDQDFLPLDTTIVTGTKVIWVNGNPSANHGVVVQDRSGQSVFSNQTIPFKNGTEFAFDIKGPYTFSDPQSPSATKGTINVVDPQNAPDSSSTNSTMPTAGLFLSPAKDKAYFDRHFTTLGYHLVDSTIIKGTTGNSAANKGSASNDIALYVYTQKSAKFETIVHRTDVKIGFLQTKMLT